MQSLVITEKDQPTIFCDVDDTLILWSRCVDGCPAVNGPLCARLEAAKAVGYCIWLWSFGGPAHAKAAAVYCGITDIVDGYCWKPSIVIDDNHAWLDRRLERQAP